MRAESRYSNVKWTLWILVAICIGGSMLVYQVQAAPPSQQWPVGWSTPQFVAVTDREAGTAALAGLPEGTLLVTRTYCKEQGSPQCAVELLRIDGDLVRSIGTAVQKSAGRVGQLHLAVLPQQGRIYLLYTVTTATETTLRLARGILTSEGEAVEFEPGVSVARSNVLRDPGIFVTDDGWVLAYWTDMTEGHLSVRASLWNPHGRISFEQRRYTSSERVQLRPAMVLFADQLFLVWVEKEFEEYRLLARSLAYDGSPLYPAVTLGSFPYREKRAPILCLGVHGTVHISWSSAAIARGEARSAGVLYARIAPDSGSLLTPPAPVTPQLGSVVGPDMVLVPEGADGSQALVTWADDRAGALSVYYARVLPDGSVLRSGRASLGEAEQLAPAGFVDAEGVSHIVYHTIDSTGRYRLYAVNDRDAAEPPWYWRLGLNYSRPWGDALFRLINVGAAAGVLAVVRMVGIVLALPLVFLLDYVRFELGSHSPERQSTAREVLVMLTLFAVPFVLERFGGVLFYRPLIYSDYLSWLSYILAAAAAVMFVANLSLRFSNWLARLLAAYMFLFWYSMLALWSASVNI